MYEQGGLALTVLSQETEDATLENEGLRKLLRLKEKEHKKIKKLAQDILSQRTEVSEEKQ